MKIGRKAIAIFLTALVLIAAVALFAACNGDDADSKEVSVVFDFNGEGEDVTVIGLSGEAMTLPEATDNDDYYFGGWHLSQGLTDAALGDDAVFPAKDTTYHAKWYVKYKFEVSVEGFDGEYERNESYDIEGEAIKGGTNAVNVTAEDFEMPEGYRLKTSSYSVELTGKDNVSQAQFALAPLKVTYVSGVSGIASVVAEGKYGMFAQDSSFEEPKDRRFFGWSTTEGGKIDVFPGDRIYAVGENTLYAVWGTAHTDVLGGSDVVFAAKGVNSNVAILSKVGFDDIKGSYDDATGLLTFEGGELPTLQGKLLDNTFFYFKDAYNRLFHSAVEGDTDTLQLKEGGGATYKNKQGVSIDGSYSVDEESGDFVFESENFTCNFKLYEPYFEGIGDITFRMKDEFEGFYAEKQADGYGYIVIYLDGYGGAFEVWDPDRPYYDPYEDIEQIYFEGEYTVLEQSAGMPQLELDIIRVPSYLMDVTYTVRLDLLEAGSFGGVTISGVYVVKDDYEGSYRNWENEENAEDELVLDGYEGATFKGEKGTYSAEVIHWYEFNGEYDDETEQPKYDVHEHKFIRFRGEDGKELLFELEINDYARYDTYSRISEEQNVFEFENSPELLYDAQGSLMLELWHDKAIVWESHAGANRITYYTKLDEGDVTDLQLGWKHFSGAAQFDYKITSLEDYTVRWRGDANQLVFEEGKLYIDEFGDGKYVDGGETVSVDYVVDSGLVNLYQFAIDGVLRVFAERDGNIVEITTAPVFAEGRSGVNLIARLIFVDESRAIVGFRLSGGISYAYLVDGSYSKDGDVYTFTYSAVEEGYESSLSDYLDFEFKAEDGKFVRNDGYEFSATGDGYTFAADGYGNATLAKDGGDTLTGTYEFLGDLTVFVYEGGEQYLSVTGNGGQRELKIVGEEAGYYYEMSEYGFNSTTSYFFFDGLGGVTFSQYNSDYATFVTSVGSYTKQNATDEDDYTLYTFTFGSNELMEGSYTVHVGFENTTDGRTVGTFWIEDPVHSGTFVVLLDGEHYGFITTQKGYALWINGNEREEGTLTRCDINDGDIYTMLSDGTREVAENVNGKSILFSSGAYGQEGYYEFLFDITDKTEQVDGVDYPVIDARMGDYGTFGRYDGGLKDERIYLDGHGNMTVYDAAGGVSDKGTVAQKEKGGNIYAFTGANGGFDFVISLRLGSSALELNRFEYVVYDEASDNVFVGEDWSVLVLDGFGGADMYDKYGMITSGTYSYVVGNIIKFEYKIVEVAYIELANGKFEVNHDEFISVGGVLYYYMGTQSDIKIPSGIHTIASGAFYGSYITSVDFASVTRIEDAALSGTSLEEIVANEATYIGDYAFAEIGVNLKRVSLPKAEHIGEGAFNGDTELDRVTLGKVSYIGSQAFTLSTIGGTTLLDLTAVADIAAVQIEDDAFVAVDFEGELLETPVTNLRVLVKDVETVNKLLSDGEVSSLISQNAVIYYGDEATSLEAAATEFGVTFYDAKSGDVYILDGKLSKILDADACVVQSEGLYLIESQGGNKVFRVYPYENGSYSLTPIVADEGFLQLGDRLLVEIGSTSYKQYEFTDNEGKLLELSARVYYDMSSGILFDAKLTYDSREMTYVVMSGAEISFVDGNKVFSMQIQGKGACTVTSAGDVKEIYSATSRFSVKVALGLDGKLKSCLEFQERSAGNYVVRNILGVTANADGSLTLRAEQLYSSVRSDLYNIVYDATSDTFTISQIGNTLFHSDDDYASFDYDITLVWDAETYRASACANFTIDGQSYEVVGFVSNSATISTITVEMDGKQVSFEVRHSDLEFTFAIISVTRV